MKIFGKVIMGKQKGKTLGFPTANVVLERKIESGVYSGCVTLNGKQYKAGIFVSPDGKFLEAYLVGFSGDLYGKEIEIRIGEKIRNVMKFKSDGELKKQIADDIKLISKS